jgi:hypothetical protein
VVVSAFRCAGFERKEQDYQIRWVRKGELEGFAIAIARHELWTDNVDFSARVRVDCVDKRRCSASRTATGVP